MIARLLAFLVLLTVLGGGAYYAYTLRHAGPGAAGVSSLALHVPQTAQAFVAVDLRSMTSTATILTRLRKFLEESPEAQKQWQEAEARLGVKADEISQWSTPAGFLAVLPPPGGTKPAVSGRAELTACKSNLKNLGTAAEMYSTDFAGLYPVELGLLTPNYLKTIPTCPAAQSVTYQWVSASQPDLYTFVCGGHHHPAEPENFPQYTSIQGLISQGPDEASQPEKPPGIVMGFPVTDVKLAQEQISKIVAANLNGQQPQTRQIGGASFSFYAETGWGFSGNLLLVGNSQEALEQVVAASQGKAPNLTALPSFAAARQRLKSESGGMVFAPLQPTLTDVVMENAKGDEQTQAGLKALQYAVAAISLEADNVSVAGFLGVDPQSTSPLAKALLTSGNTPFTTAEVAPAEWDTWSAYDLHWVYRVLRAVLEMAPETREQARNGVGQAEVVSGLSIEDDIFGGFTGEVGYTTDYLRQAGKKEASPSGLIMLAIKDQQKADKVLGKLDPLVKWEPGKKVGDIQLYTTQDRIAKALRPGPRPILLVAFGDDPQSVIEKALASKTSVASTPAYEKARGDQPQDWFQATYVNLEPLRGVLEGLLTEVDSSDDAVKLGKKLLSQYKGGIGITYALVAKDGLRWGSSGQGTAELAVGGGAVVAAILVPNFIRARSQGQTTACKSNLKNIGTALEMYSTDYAGLYPVQLSDLTPNYLRTIPTCPSVASVTYVGVTASKPDLYTVICSGHNHQGAGLPENFPQYNSIEGLIERP